jgi:ATP-dependent protease Clp ATPase subunit
MSVITVGEAFEVCDFCRKRRDDVRLLIASPFGHHICDECVEVGAKLVAERIAEMAKAPA